MKRVAALLLCVLLFVSSAIPAGAQAQKLLYPGPVVAGDHVYLVGIPMEGGNVSVTANGQAIPSQLVSVAGVQLGITYYCVVSTASSMSLLQRNQQRAGVTALSNAIGSMDSMVLVTMGRTVEFSEKLTDKATRSKAVEEACERSVYGTNLYEGIDNVLKTIKEREEGPCCVIFFTDGIDNADTVKVTEEQASRVLQNSGLCVNFVALMTPPMNDYCRKLIANLQHFATMSNGGTCQVPLEMNSEDATKAAKEAAERIVSSVGGWAAIELNAADLPRDGQRVELNVTWSGNGATVEDSTSVSVADLPELPAPTEPETRPAPTLPTRPTVETAAASIERPSVPVYQDDNNQQLYYVIIGSAVAMVLVMLAMVIVATRRVIASRQDPDERYEHDMPMEATDVPEDPNEAEALEKKISGVQNLPPRRKPAPADLLLPDMPEVPKPAKKPLLKQEPEKKSKQKPMLTADKLFSISDDAPKNSMENALAGLRFDPQMDGTPKAEPSEKKSKRKTAQPIQPTDETFVVPSCTVLLVPVGNSEGTVEVAIPANESRTFGRNQKSNVVLNATDNALSGLHFELQWDGRVLYLNDRHSTNGTTLNGSPQRPDHWGRVESGAIIQAGSVRYKVSIVNS